MDILHSTVDGSNVLALLFLQVHWDVGHSKSQNQIRLILLMYYIILSYANNFAFCPY